MAGPLTSLITKDRLVELDPPRATLEQARYALTNRLGLIEVDHDVWGVVYALKRIDPGLTMFYDERERIYVLYWKGLREVDGIACQVEDFVGAYTELDPRVVKLIERIDAQGRGRHDLQRELDRLEEEKDREHEWQQSQQTGAAAEHLRYALRRDLGLDGSSVQLSASRGGEKMRKERRRQQKMGRRTNR